MNLVRWGWYSIIASSALVALNGAVAVRSRSLAVTAELMHTLLDLLSATAVLIGLKLATRKTKTFPYGMYKLENLVAAALAVLVFLTAYNVARDALVAASRPVRVDGWMLALLGAAVVIPLLFSHFALRVGQESNSPALIASAKEYRVHLVTAGLALLALGAQRLKFPIDRAAALVIVGVIIKTGWDILQEAMRALLDASLDFGTLRRLEDLMQADPAVSEVMWVTGRNAGRYRFVEAAVAVRTADLAKAEAVRERIDVAVRAAVPHIERVLIRMETSASPYIRFAVPLADQRGTVSEHFGQAPHFALVTMGRNDGVIEETRIVTNPYRTEEKAKGIRVAEWLVTQKIDVALVNEDLRGPGPVYVLRDAGVQLRRTRRATLTDALASAQQEITAQDSRSRPPASDQ